MAVLTFLLEKDQSYKLLPYRLTCHSAMVSSCSRVVCRSSGHGNVSSKLGSASQCTTCISTRTEHTHVPSCSGSGPRTADDEPQSDKSPSSMECRRCIDQLHDHQAAKVESKVIAPISRRFVLFVYRTWRQKPGGGDARKQRFQRTLHFSRRMPISSWKRREREVNSIKLQPILRTLFLCFHAFDSPNRSLYGTCEE